MKIYHLCCSSHDEVMFRSREDLIYGANCFAVACLETDSVPLCDAELSTHLHDVAMSNDPKYLMKRSRNYYSRHFNSKYKRKGKLGEEGCFIMELVGARHVMAGMSYVLRQGLHHGITDSPFGYEFCSINSVFRREMGREEAPAVVSERARYRMLPSHASVPARYRMAESGLLLREDTHGISFVENVYVSPRNFLFQMNRKSGEEWEREQREEDPGSKIITLGLIERGVADDDLSTMLNNEQGRNSFKRLTDLQLCELIDTKYVPRYDEHEGATIYDLPESKRADLANRLDRDLNNARQSRDASGLYLPIPPKQMHRCAVIKK